MKFMHISDLHIGKRVNEFSLVEEQKHILGEILELLKKEAVQGLLVAGDIYDKVIPSAEAVDIFDEFLTQVAQINIPIFIISGNHDSPERLEFGSRIMHNNNIYIYGEYDAKVQKIALNDEYGPVNVFLLPYIKPVIVNKKLSSQTESYQECVQLALQDLKLDTSQRNILVAHQFVTAAGLSPERSESESISLGGVDNVDFSVFADFDYVALGHIHRAQKIGRDTVRYSGSPLKYSFSECNHNKSVTMVEIKQKGEIFINLISLNPLRDLQELKTTLAELQSGSTLGKVSQDNYVHITLTDEQEILDAIGKVREIYPNVMLLDFENKRSQNDLELDFLTNKDLQEKTPEQLFADFYLKQNNQELTNQQQKILQQVLAEALQETER